MMDPLGGYNQSDMILPFQYGETFAGIPNTTPVVFGMPGSSVSRAPTISHRHQLRMLRALLEYCHDTNDTVYTWEAIS